MQKKQKIIFFLPNSSLHLEQCNLPLTDKTRLLLLLIVVRIGDFLNKNQNWIEIFSLEKIPLTFDFLNDDVDEQMDRNLFVVAEYFVIDEK
jgi:hypothetical protein